VGRSIKHLSGECYCGRTQVRSTGSPQTVVYCHCTDCRRVTGAPVTAWVAFADSDVEFTPDSGRLAPVSTGARRSFCGDCGSPLAHQYDYAEGQTFVAVGLFDDATELHPAMHAHYGSRLPWLEIHDDLDKIDNTSRTQLAAAKHEVRP